MRQETTTRLFVITTLLILTIASCTKNEQVIEPPPPSEENIPVITSATNIFTFSVDADTLTATYSDTLYFDADSLSYTLVVSNYVRGQASITVTNKAGLSVRSDSLNRNLVLLESRSTGRIPARYVFSASNFTGKVSIVLSAMRPSRSGADAFPLGVGSAWQYALYDSSFRLHPSVLRDTVDVTIKNNLGGSNGLVVTLWTFQYRHDTTVNVSFLAYDTLYVARHGDTIMLSHDLASLPWLEFAYPLILGKKVTLSNGNSFEVIGIEDLNVPAGTFANCARVRLERDMPNEISYYDYWISPAAGIVQIFEVYGTTVDPYREQATWQLLSYYVVN